MTGPFGGLANFAYSIESLNRNLGGDSATDFRCWTSTRAIQTLGGQRILPRFNTFDSETIDRGAEVNCLRHPAGAMYASTEMAGFRAAYSPKASQLPFLDHSSNG